LAVLIRDFNGDTATCFANYEKEGLTKISPQKGMNKLDWGLRYASGKRFDGIIFWAGDLSGPMAIPGSYEMEIKWKDTLIRQSFTIKKDPRVTASPEDYAAYFKFVKEVRDTISAGHKAIVQIRDLRQQLMSYKERIKDDTLKKEITRIDSVMTKIEEALYQTKNRSGQDPLNFPVRLTNKLAYLNGLLDEGNYPPTDQAFEVRQELETELSAELEKFDKVKREMIPALNQQMRDKKIDAIILKDKS
ncbi:MAG TPA: hypothetical protein VJ508_19825, partial [Saprospiraceae bacterium]|nr:hypothetical protein [Saprospiraceae bacterium]